jgi:hypothetical protein
MAINYTIMTRMKSIVITGALLAATLAILISLTIISDKEFTKVNQATINGTCCTNMTIITFQASDGRIFTIKGQGNIINGHCFYNLVKKYIIGGQVCNSCFVESWVNLSIASLLAALLFNIMAIVVYIVYRVGLSRLQWSDNGDK